jgi:rRNA maturation endonuclease Nob1
MKIDATFTSINSKDGLYASGAAVRQKKFVLEIMQNRPLVAWTIGTMRMHLIGKKITWCETATLSRVFNDLKKSGDIEQSDADQMKCPVTRVMVMARRLSAKHVQSDFVV